MICNDGLRIGYSYDETKIVVKKVKERIVLREIHLRTTGRHLSMGSHSVICHPRQM